MDFSKKLIIFLLIAAGLYFAYKKYLEKEIHPLKKNVRNVDFFQSNINESLR
jgi:hypothetical protein